MSESGDLRRTAMDHLARREHSRYELLVKLQKKYPEAPEDVLSSVLDRLEQDKLLSDTRFAEAYVHYRKGKGYGPLHIRQHLQACRVSPELISEYVQLNDPAWLEQLRDLLRRKFPDRSLARTGRDFESCADASADSWEDDDDDRDARRAAQQAQWLRRQKLQQKIQRFVLSRGFTLEQLTKAE